MSLEGWTILWVGLALGTFFVAILGVNLGFLMGLREDIRALDTRLTGEIRAVAGDLRAVESKLSGEIKDVDRKLSGKIDELRDDVAGLDKELAVVKSQTASLDKRMAVVEESVGVLLGHTHSCPIEPRDWQHRRSRADLGNS